MAVINKLSVEKTLNKLRANDAKQSKEAVFNNKTDALDEEIERMRAQRLRLERHQRKSVIKTNVEGWFDFLTLSAFGYSTIAASERRRVSPCHRDFHRFSVVNWLSALQDPASPWWRGRSRGPR